MKTTTTRGLGMRWSVTDLSEDGSKLFCSLRRAEVSLEVSANRFIRRIVHRLPLTALLLFIPVDKKPVSVSLTQLPKPTISLSISLGTYSYNNIFKPARHSNHPYSSAICTISNITYRHSVGAHQGNELIRNSSGNAQAQSSQLAEPLWTDKDIKSRIGVHKLISTVKK